MANKCVFIILLVLLNFVTNCACDCVNARTSEGYVTLLEGQRACGPLQSDENEGDKGKRFLTCIYGNVHMQPCPQGLRFDVRLGLCNWPQLSTCQLGSGNEETSMPTRLPTTSPRSRTATSPLATTTRLTKTSQGTTTSPPVTTPRLSTTRAPVTTKTTSQTTHIPQPTPSRPAGPCNSTNCRLPECFCFDNNPSDIPLNAMPRFIALTFDDHVSTDYYNSYFKALAVDNDYQLFNPSGKRVRFAFYVNHDNTDYSKVKALWEAGHEIGSHTYHHRLPIGNSDSDYQEMVSEIQGLKNEVFRATGNKTLVDSMTGFRAPYLLPGGNVQYDVLRDFGFLYDTSIFNINLLQRRQPRWPYTLDFVVRECTAPPCPTKPYPGLWEYQLNGWIGDDGEGCSMADGCVVGTNAWTATEEQWYSYYKRNFEQYFSPMKVPMPIFIHATLFNNHPRSRPALIRWLQDTLRDNTNVWVVSPKQVIQWMKHQLSNDDMIAQQWS